MAVLTDQRRGRRATEGIDLEISQSLGTVAADERAEDSRAEPTRTGSDMSGIRLSAVKQPGRWSWRVSIALVLALSLILWIAIARLLSIWLG